jgi:hypothetical protein
MMFWKAALVAMATSLLGASLAEARPRSGAAAGEAVAIMVRGHRVETIRSPVTGELLYRVPRRFVVGRAAPRFVARSLMLHPTVWVPRRARRILIQYPGYGQAGAAQPPHVLRELDRQGYRDIGGLTRRGGNYVGEATGPRGERQRIIIDPQGRIRGSSPSGGGRGGGRPPGGGGFYGGY